MRAAGDVLHNPPAFTAWLVNGDGEPIDGPDGPAERFTDPVAYVRAYVEAMAAEFPGTQDVLARANADDIAKACAISPEALALLAKAPEPEPPAAATSPVATAAPAAPPVTEAPQKSRWAIEPPRDETKIEWERFNDRLKLTLESATTLEQISAVMELNSDTWDQFPGRFRLAAKALVEARMKAIPPTNGAGVPAASGVPTHQETADRLLKDIAACKTLADMESLERNAAIIRMFRGLAAGAPDLHKVVRDAAQVRAKEVQQQGNAAP